MFQGIHKVAKGWLFDHTKTFVAKGGLAGAHEDGSASTQEAAYTLGVARNPTIAAIRKAWQAYRAGKDGVAALTKAIPAAALTK